MTQHRLMEDPPEIEAESKELFERWSTETGEGEIDCFEWSVQRTSSEGVAYMEEARRYHAEAEARGEKIG